MSTEEKIPTPTPTATAKPRRPRPPNAAPPFQKGEERARAAGRKGAQARKEKLALFKSLRDAALALKDIPAKGRGFSQMSNGVATIAAMYEASQRGDAKAANFLAKLMGEMVERVETTNTPILLDDIPPTETTNPNTPTAPAAPTPPTPTE